MDPQSWLFKALEFYGTRLPHPGQERIHTFLRERLRANVDADLEVTRDGHRWLLNPADFVQTEFFWLGQRDVWDIRHAIQLVRPDDVIFDIGANFGHYAITLASAAGAGAEVHAFEPFPANAARLRTNIGLNKLERTVHVHPIGLSDAIGVGSMMIRSDNSGAATLAVTAGSAVAAQGIELTTLDAFCDAQATRRLDFVKADVEGYEEKLLAGGARTLKRFAPLMLMEFDPPKLIRAGSSVDRVAARLGDLGYELWVSERDRLVPLKDLPREQDYINVFCVPAARRAEFPRKP